MSLYVDSSALAKRYVDEPRRHEAELVLVGDPVWLTAMHTFVEVSLILGRRLNGEPLRVARLAFKNDWARSLVIDLDQALCDRAAVLGGVAATRALDALHLAAAERAGGRSIPIVTFDVRLARAARSLGFAVIGS